MISHSLEMKIRQQHEDFYRKMQHHEDWYRKMQQSIKIQEYAQKKLKKDQENIPNQKKNMNEQETIEKRTVLSAIFVQYLPSGDLEIHNLQSSQLLAIA